MDKTHLFQSLAAQDSSVLLDLLSVAYDRMDHSQRQSVFGKMTSALLPVRVDGEELLDEVEAFQRESLAGAYYAPFATNSKNWTHIPDETEEWFERLGDLLKASAQLTAQGDHQHAVACFGTLYKLIDALEEGKDIVFGEEVGSWMIPGDQKQFVTAYMTSLAAVASPQEFTAAALPLIQRDSWHSFADQVYLSAIHAANAAQKEHLEAEIERQKIRKQPKT
jgi:hypothetical protein